MTEAKGVLDSKSNGFFHEPSMVMPGSELVKNIERHFEISTFGLNHGVIVHTTI